MSDAKTLIIILFLLVFSTNAFADLSDYNSSDTKLHS